MKAKSYTRKEFVQILNKNGFEYVRCKGSHFVYKRNGETVSVPKNLNKMIGLRLVKEHNLTV